MQGKHSQSVNYVNHINHINHIIHITIDIQSKSPDDVDLFNLSISPCRHFPHRYRQIDIAQSICDMALSISPCRYRLIDIPLSISPFYRYRPFDIALSISPYRYFPIDTDIGLSISGIDIGLSISAIDIGLSISGIDIGLLI
eukprot:1268241-Amorphochlora_amoeboformis.AAC.1